MVKLRRWNWVVLGAIGTLLFVAGCGKGNDGATSDTPSTDTAASSEGGEAEVAAHGEWWCGEHGVPEEECSICSSAAAEKFRAKGDWCEKHNRAESQCFICDPSRAERYVKLYEAKFGKKPPKPKG